MWKERKAKEEESDSQTRSSRWQRVSREGQAGAGKASHRMYHRRGVMGLMCYTYTPWGLGPLGLARFCSAAFLPYLSTEIQRPFEPKVCSSPSHTSVLIIPVPWNLGFPKAARPFFPLTHQPSNPPLPLGTLLPGNRTSAQPKLGKTHLLEARLSGRQGEREIGVVWGAGRAPLRLGAQP